MIFMLSLRVIGKQKQSLKVELNFEGYICIDLWRVFRYSCCTDFLF